MKRRNVKVIQPGLVYVIDWQSGESPSAPAVSGEASPKTPMSPRDQRRFRRDLQRDVPDLDGDDDDEEVTPGVIYVACVFPFPPFLYLFDVLL